MILPIVGLLLRVLIIAFIVVVLGPIDENAQHTPKKVTIDQSGVFTKYHLIDDELNSNKKE